MKVAKYLTLCLSVIMPPCIAQSLEGIVAHAVKADFFDIASLMYNTLDGRSSFPASLSKISDDPKINTTDWLSLESTCRRIYGYAVASGRDTAILTSVGSDHLIGTGDDMIFEVTTKEILFLENVSSKDKLHLIDQALKSATGVGSCN